jgi:hypothetical protein
LIKSETRQSKEGKGEKGEKRKGGSVDEFKRGRTNEYYGSA